MAIDFNKLESYQPIKASLAIPVTTSPSANKIRFGQDSISLSLPAWTKRVKDPTVNLKSLMDRYTDLASQRKEGSKLKSISAVFKMVGDSWRIYRQYTHASLKYLPNQAKKDLRHYKWTIGLYDRVFRRKRYELMSIVYQGPLAIKSMQVIAQKLAPTVPKLEQNLTDLTMLQNDRRVREERLKGGSGLIPPLVRGTYFIWIPLLKHLNRMSIKTIQNKLKLLNQVPALPKSSFKTEINKLKEVYNKENSANPIVSVGEVLNAGSIGQVFEAKTKNGSTLVLKMIKPHITAAYLDEYKPYEYFLTQVLKGTGPAEKRLAAKEAEDTVGMLKHEVNPKEEAKNIVEIAKAVSNLGIKGFKIPPVLATTEKGLILPYVGEMDLANMQSRDKDELLTKMVPDLVRLLILSSVKPLDVHSGNTRSKDANSNGVPYLIDHGRQINMNSESHKKVLKLLTSYFATDSSIKEAVLEPHVQSSLESLLKIDESYNRSLLAALNQVKSMSNIQSLLSSRENMDISPKDSPEVAAKKKTELQQLNVKLKPYDEITSKLTAILGIPKPPKLWNTSAKNQDFAKQELNERRNFKLSLFSVWGNVLTQVNDRSNTQISNLPISHSDLLVNQNKLREFIRPYFWAVKSPNEDTEIRKTLASIDQKEFHKAFRKDVNDRWPPSMFMNQIDHKIFESAYWSCSEVDYFKNHPDNLTDDEFSKAIQSLLKSGNPKGELLVRAYRVNSRLQELADTLSQDLQSHLPLPLNNELGRQKLTAQVLKALREELQLEDPSEYMGTQKTTGIASIANPI